ncbi:hypothetical protein SDC9_179486 [bioreactor metagenome]|uniref:Phage portal protein n=1 Tax=bioreactor metagenome TaxID=1076179 RepID=A0A645GYY9_9ZZZZ
MNPIPVVVGQKLGIGKNGEGAIPSNLVGTGLQLDDGGSFGFANGQLDYKSFESVWKVLKQALLDISCTPAVSMNNTDISNLSETSIKLLFGLADVRGNLNEKFMRDGIMQRLKKFEKLLGIKGIGVDVDEIELTFICSRPLNEADIIDNLKTLRDMGAISLQSTLEQNPYVFDVASEMDKIKAEKGSMDNTGNVNTQDDTSSGNVAK